MDREIIVESEMFAGFRVAPFDAEGMAAVVRRGRERLIDTINCTEVATERFAMASLTRMSAFARRIRS